MTVRQKKDFLINITYWTVIGVIVFLLGKYIVPIVIPFILAYFIARVVVRISDNIRLNKKFVRIVLTTVLYGTVGVLISLLVVKCATSCYDLVLKFPKVYDKEIHPVIDDVYKWGQGIIKNLEPSIGKPLMNIGEGIMSSLDNLVGFASKYLIKFVTGIAKAVPSTFINILIMVISTFFFVLDYERMREFIRNNVPIKVKEGAKTIRSYVTSTLFVVLRSYALIMLLTFTELSILFLIFRIKHGFVLAGIMAVFDIMPVLGTGGILIPWAISSFIVENPVLGIKLLIIYAIITIVRNYVEPRIVGAQLGLHPIITLVSMFIGLRLFGFIGMFGLPVSISFLWKRYRERALS